MKKLLFIAFAIALIGCKTEAKPDYAIISGKITNKQAGDLTINSEDRTFKETLSVTADGTFTDTLSTDISSYILYDGTCGSAVPWTMRHAGARVVPPPFP